MAILPRNGHELMSLQFRPYLDGTQLAITELELDQLAAALDRPVLPHLRSVESAIRNLTLTVWHVTVAPDAREFEKQLLSIRDCARQLHTSLNGPEGAPLIQNPLFILAAMQAGIASSQLIESLETVANLSAKLAGNFAAYRDARSWRDFALLAYLKDIIYVANHAKATMTLPTNGEASEIDDTGNLELAKPLLTFAQKALEIGSRKAVIAIQESPHLPDRKLEAIAILERYQALSWRSLTEALRRAKRLTARRMLQAAKMPYPPGRPPIS
jgi:hypothetical protein